MDKSQKRILQEHINMMVENIMDEQFLTEKDKEKKDSKKKESKDDDKKPSKSKDSKESKNDDDTKYFSKEEHRNKKNTKAAGRRARVIQWLKDPSVNCAEIMRKLWKPSEKKEDAARSFFYKCRDGALNDSGAAYSFSDGDINRLYAIKNNLI